MSNISDAGKSIKIKVNEVVKGLNNQVKARSTRVINELHNAELEVLSGKRSGKIYRKPKTIRATYRASAPGEAPAKCDGNLREKWRGEINAAQTSNTKVQITAAIVSGSRYSRYLDEGTPGGKIAPRPFKEPIIEKAKPKIEAILREPYH